MPLRDLGLILIVVLAWGSNFSAMKLALDEVPPFLFVGLRFAILLPLLAVLPRPQVPWSKIIAVGLFINMGQFAFLFAAMRADASAGLASLLLQMQAPMTILFSVLFLRETIRPVQVAGMFVALVGVAIIAAASGGSVSLLGLFLIMCGALCWATGNMVLKTLPGVAMLPLFIWASLIPPLPMLALSWLTEGSAPVTTLLTVSPVGWISVIYVAVISTVLGYSLWGALLSRHPAAIVTPFALLIPVVGLATAAAILGERPTGTEWWGITIILLGLSLTQISPLLARMRRTRP